MTAATMAVLLSKSHEQLLTDRVGGGVGGAQSQSRWFNIPSSKAASTERIDSNGRPMSAQQRELCAQQRHDLACCNVKQKKIFRNHLDLCSDQKHPDFALSRRAMSKVVHGSPVEQKGPWDEKTLQAAIVKAAKSPDPCETPPTPRTRV